VADELPHFFMLFLWQYQQIQRFCGY